MNFLLTITVKLRLITGAAYCSDVVKVNFCYAEANISK